MMSNHKKLMNTNKITTLKKTQETACFTKKINRKVYPLFPKKQSPKTRSHLPSKTQHINKFYLEKNANKFRQSTRPLHYQTLILKKMFKHTKNVLIMDVYVMTLN